jgi:hypothetical protein
MEMEISCAMVASVVRKRKRKEMRTYPSIYAQVAAYNN